ncbi:MAG: acyl-CoA thioesterase [Sulfobacillus acidophilus]|uniref:Acyl-CoA thioesterase n=1 Tax=Sulfobacillus acidophilus TaxID=53633 RepID=A0A2T2WHV4_9FIRM|nr:MAG: acyl-CoA thioesterase [Sulfobacillus acidophilus]
MHTTRITVRFGETDMAGHVNNAVYLSYLEEARLNFLQDILQISEFPLILASAHLDFIRQVFFPDRVTIETGICRIGQSSIDMVHQLYSDSQHVLALNSLVTLVFFDYAAQKPAPVPLDWRSKFESQWTAPPQSRTR